MIRSVKTALPVLSLFLLAGCQDMPNWMEPQQSSAVPPTQAGQPPANSLQPPSADPGAPGSTDPHRQDTIEDVLAFVDRLNAAPPLDPSRRTNAGPEGSSTAATGGTTAQQPQSAGAAVPVGLPPSRANQPLEVAAGPVEPEAQSPPAPPMPEKPVLESVFIRSTAAQEQAAAEADPTRTTNTPLSAAGQTAAVLSVEALIATLQDRVKSDPADLGAQWELRLLQLASGDDQAARDLPDGAAGDFVEPLRHAVNALIAVRDALQHPLTQAEPAVAAVEALNDAVRRRADLLIPTVALCTRVQTFGVYDELATEALQPNRANRAIVYVEVANFASEATPDGRYRTVLSNELEVLTPQGQSLWRQEESNIVDLSRRPRHDFFLAQMVTLPATLGAGEYVLKVTLQDDLSGKSNQAVHPFSVGAALAGTPQ